MAYFTTKFVFNIPECFSADIIPLSRIYPQNIQALHIVSEVLSIARRPIYYINLTTSRKGKTTHDVSHKADPLLFAPGYESIA